MKTGRVVVIVLLVFCSILSIGRAETIKKFTSPDAVHLWYNYSGLGTVYDSRKLYLVDGGGARTLIADGLGELYGTYRVAPLDNSPYQVVMEIKDGTNTTDTTELAFSREMKIEGTAIFDETLSPESATTSSGFTVDNGHSVSLDDTSGNITWQQASFNVWSGGELTLKGCRMTKGAGIGVADTAVLTLDSCLIGPVATTTNSSFFSVGGGGEANIRDCLINTTATTTLGCSNLVVRDSEFCRNVWIYQNGTADLQYNTFYGPVRVLAGSGTSVKINNNTLAYIISIDNGTSVNTDNNYYEALPSTRDATYGWLTPWHLEKTIPCLKDGDLERAPFSDPRNPSPFRLVRMAAGHSVIYPDWNNNGSIRLRAGLPFVVMFELKSSVAKLDGVDYELVFNGKTYHPKGNFVATAKQEISYSSHNADDTLNFFLPAVTAPGTNQWDLYADLSGCNANIVIPSPAKFAIASSLTVGPLVFKPAYKRPLRIGVVEVVLKDRTTGTHSAKSNVAKARKQIRRDLLTKLPLCEKEVEIYNLHQYIFTGGWFCSWLSQTSYGLANQLTAELQFAVNDYNSTGGKPPLDFVVGVVPVNALGGADGLSQALRRKAILVDEFSPDAALHELGHAMGLYRKTEQYDMASGWQGTHGYIKKGRGLELASMTAYNHSSQPDSLIAPGTLRNFQGGVHSSVYDVMGCAQPHWISADTYGDMVDWLDDHLGYATSVTTCAISSTGDADIDSGSNRIVHVAALLTHNASDDTVIPGSVKVAQSSGDAIVTEGIYYLNYQFRSFDAGGNLLDWQQCTTIYSYAVTNKLWLQDFSVPKDAVQYQLVHTFNHNAIGGTVVWSNTPLPSMSNSLSMNYDATNDEYVINWQAPGTPRTIVNRLMESDDGGATWSPLPLPIYTNSIRIARSDFSAGTPQFKLFSTDGFTNTVSSAVVGIAATNLPPLVSIITPLSGAQGITGTVWNLQADISDPDDNLATIEWRSDLAGVLGTNSAITNLLDSGTHTITVCATDSGGLSATSTVQITVTTNLPTIDLAVATNDLRVIPSVNGYGLNAVAYGITNSLQLTVRNQGISNIVRVLVYCTPPSGTETNIYDEDLSMAAFDSRTIVTSLVATVRGTYTVRARCIPLTVPDSYSNNNQIVVAYTNEPPQVFPRRISVFAGDLPLHTGLKVQDPNGDAVTLALVAGDHASIVTNTLTFDNGGTPGDYPLSVTASDGSATSAPVTITVSVYSDTVLVPTITSGTSFAATSGVPLTIQITATNGPCTFSAMGLPAGLTIDPASGLISGTVSNAATYNFTVSAQNVNRSDSAQITLQVTNPGPYVPGDYFADAFVLSGVPIATNADTTGATTEFGEPGVFGSEKTIWWVWTAPSNGVAGVSWSGVFMYSEMAAYTGAVVSNLTLISKIEDHNGTLIFDALAGTTYHIRFSTWAESPINIELRYHFEPVLKAPLSIACHQNQPMNVALTTYNTATNFAAQNLPNGLSIDPATGNISGTPIGYTNVQSIIVLRNAAGVTSNNIGVRVWSTQVPRITSPLYVTALVGSNLVYTVTATNAAPDTLYGGPAPAGMSYDYDNHSITGAPSESGSYEITLNAGNTNTSEYISEKMTMLVRASYTQWKSAAGFSAAQQSDPAISGPDADPDGDGASNYQEYVAGTDPLDPHSCFRAEIMAGSAHRLQVSWPGVAGHYYRIQQADDLGNGFTTITGIVTQARSTNSVEFTPSNPAVFFRIRVGE